MADAAPAQATDTTTTTAETATTTEAAPTVESLTAELEQWKKDARKHEDRAKEHAAKAKELDALHRASMSDSEKAIATARDEGRAAALLETGSRLVDAEFRVATAGRNIDVDALLEGLDRSKFLTDGEPNVEAVKAWVERIAPASTETTTEQQKPLTDIDLGQGTRTSPMALNGDPLTDSLKAAVGAT